MNVGMNRLIPIVGLVTIAIATAVGLRACSRKEPPPPPDPMTALPEAPAPDADTPADTVRTLSARVADLLESTEKLTEENRTLREEAAALIERQRRIDERIRARVNEALAANRTDADKRIASLTERIDRLATRVGNLSATAQPPAEGTSDLPVGFGGSGATPIHWVEPLDGPAPKDTLSGFRPPGLGAVLPNDAGKTGDDLAALARERAASLGEDALAEPEPVYTIPANATLFGATALTAMIGRIPIGGQVQDPVPFKALVGADNLAANGHEIPGLLGMVVSGYAVGDWTLSCVSGRVTSATFVFEDGRIVTFGAPTVEPGSVGQGGNRNRKNRTELGWISDRFGTPCVSGKRVTNAPQYLAQRVGLATLEAAAEAAAAAQTTSVYSPTGGTATSVTGDQNRYVLGRAAADGVGEVGRWLKERQAQSWDAVYVPPGASVAIHLDVNLPIDRDPAGRMVDHRLAAKSGGRSHGHLD